MELGKKWRNWVKMEKNEQKRRKWGKKRGNWG